jgi:ubiquinone/menaquinone biosynthesis C-methylase UbiE
LPLEDQSVDTVVLAEILEHVDNPGEILAEACRVAGERVVVSLPLNGWSDRTHQWRISLDYCRGETGDPTKSEQIVLTFQRGTCWPLGYEAFDEDWHRQFVEGH